jgi:hypothetical protein
MQRLAELETDNAAAEHRDRPGQVLPLEHVVAGREQIADGLEQRRVDWPRAGRDQDPPGRHHRVVADLQPVVVDEARVPVQAMRRRHLLDHVEHRADEVVAQGAEAGHHRPAIDLRRPGLDPEYRGFAHRVRRPGGGDQQLARHAADPGAGGAVHPALDQDHTLGVLAHLAIGREPRRPGADDRDVDLALRHACSPRAAFGHPAFPRKIATVSHPGQRPARM